MEQEQVNDYTRLDQQPGNSHAPDVDNLDRRVRQLMRERPLLALGVAVAAGFAIGRVLRRL